MIPNLPERLRRMDLVPCNEAADRIEHLEAQLAEANSLHEALVDGQMTLSNELQECRKDAVDAKRYRWLRGILNKATGGILNSACLVYAEFWHRAIARNGTLTAITMPAHAELDAYIDQAISEEK